MELVRIDPPLCNCADCSTGVSVSVDRATGTQLDELIRGNLEDATGCADDDLRLFFEWSGTMTGGA